MKEVNVKEARSNLSTLLNKVNHGEEIAVTRHGKKVAYLVPPESLGGLPSLREFRETIRISGQSLSDSVVMSRKHERY